MAFRDLPVEELRRIAEYYVIDVPLAANPEKPTKKELLAAFAEGDEPLTWEQYEETYKPKQLKTEEELDTTPPVKEEKVIEPVDTSNYVLVKYGRKNPTWEQLGYTFTARHPFASVPPDVAEYLVRNVEGFRLALPSELQEYYN